MTARARTPLVVAVVAAAVLAAAPPAPARTFGANLRRVPNATATCQSFSLFALVPSCSWTTSGSLALGAREAMVVPGNGRITRVRVRVGPRTGPMRISILQSLRRQNGGETACCIGRRQSRVFTPRRNAITTVRVNLPVSVTFNRRSRIYAFDVMFLTMENASTPIPADAGNPNTDNCSGGWFPAVRPGRENFGGPYGVCGYTILINADWQPARRRR